MNTSILPCASRPWAMLLMALLPALSLAAPFAYIPNSGDNTISVIDTKTDKVIETIKTLPQGPAGAFGIGVAPDTDSLIVTQADIPNFDAPGTVTEVSTATPYNVSSVAQTRVPLGVSVDPTGKFVYETNLLGGYVAVFAITPPENGLQWVDQYNLDLFLPFGIDSGRFNDEKNIHLYVTESGGNRVAVIDTETKSIVTRIDVGRTPKGIVLSADYSRAYVANYDDDTVSVIDTAQHQVIAVIPVGFQPFAVAVDATGNRLFVTNQTANTGGLKMRGSVSVIDTRSLREFARVRVGRQPSGIAMDLVTKKVYVANTGSNSVSVIKGNAENPRVIRRIKVGDRPIAFGYFTSRSATPQNQKWSAIGSGLNGTVHCVARHPISGEIYVGGEFTSAGDVTTSRIAKWDGSAWSALGTGMSGDYYPSVYALAFDSAGNLYAGGNFNVAGLVMASFIAKWDGSSWSALDTGTNGTVLSMAIDKNGNLYVGGGFDTAGGVTAKSIAKWDGSSWSSLGSGLENEVYALAIDKNNNLYAGGGFEYAGDVKVNHIAKWNGTSWFALDSGVSDGTPEDFTNVMALTYDRVGNLYVGGNFTKAGPVKANYIAKWDGSSWSALGEGLNGYVRAFALDRLGNLYTGGDFTNADALTVNRIARWGGSSWSAFGSGIADAGAWVSALAFDKIGSLYVGGSFTNAGGIPANYIAKLRSVK